MLEHRMASSDGYGSQQRTQRSSTLKAFLQQDFMPNCREHVDRVKSPLGLLVAAAITSFICGWFVGVQGYLMFGMCSGVIVIGMAWPLLCVRGLRCEQWWCVPRVVEGSATEVVVRVSNRWPWPVWGVAVNGLGPSSCFAIGRIPGRSQREYRWQFVAPLRGRYPQQPLQVSTRFPFGLWEGFSAISCAAPLLVWPRPEPRSIAPPSAVRRVGSESTSRNVGADGDVNGVRAYRRGDRLRDVHWGQTARLSNLMVKDRQTPPLIHIRIVLDLNPAHHHGDGADSSFEQCVRLAAGLVQHYLERDERVLLVLGRQQISGHGRGAALTHMMDSLSLVALAASGMETSAPLAPQDGEAYLVTSVLAKSTPRSRSVRVVVA